MMLEDHMKLCVTEPDFLEKICLPQNLLKDLVIDFYWRVLSSSVPSDESA